MTFAKLFFGNFWKISNLLKDIWICPVRNWAIVFALMGTGYFCQKSINNQISLQETNVENTVVQSFIFVCISFCLLDLWLPWRSAKWHITRSLSSNNFVSIVRSFLTNHLFFSGVPLHCIRRWTAHWWIFEGPNKKRF